jgi:hypothetical protein
MLAKRELATCQDGVIASDEQTGRLIAARICKTFFPEIMRPFFLPSSEAVAKFTFLRQGRINRSVESGSGIRTGPRETRRGPQRRAGEGEVARKRVARGAQVREKVLAWGSTCSFLCRPAFARASNCVAPEVAHGRLSARLASSTVTLAERVGRLYLLSTNSLRRRRRTTRAARNGPAEKNGTARDKTCRPGVAFQARLGLFTAREVTGARRNRNPKRKFKHVHAAFAGRRSAIPRPAARNAG